MSNLWLFLSTQLELVFSTGFCLMILWNGDPRYLLRFYTTFYQRVLIILKFWVIEWFTDNSYDLCAFVFNSRYKISDKHAQQKIVP